MADAATRPLRQPSGPVTGVGVPMRAGAETKVAFDADGSLLATCCRSGAVQLWRLWPDA
ncbi:WD40 repeat domain-containing protein [Streptosporangium vulgare]|uniref:WD40 repeat domain-containing protein n=1 Tax=Streptosporangium vulgare TaxID=46190 RepID=A0ABV5TEV6_9ACTN